MTAETTILFVLRCFLAGLVIGTAWTLKKHRAGLVLLLLLPCTAQAQVPTSFHGTSNSWSPMEQDKRKHLAAGAAVGVFAFVVADLLDYETPWWHAIAWAFVAGFAKELRDRKLGGRPEWSDVAYTGAGGIAISIPLRRAVLRRRVEFATAPPLVKEGSSPCD